MYYLPKCHDEHKDNYGNLDELVGTDVIITYIQLVAPPMLESGCRKFTCD
jgi:hypothetical protein